MITLISIEVLSTWHKKKILKLHESLTVFNKLKKLRVFSNNEDINTKGLYEIAKDML